MDIYQLAYFMEDVVPKIEELDGYLFFDRFDDGAEGLRKKAGQYASLAEAQSWMNIVLLESFIDGAVGDDWEMNDPSIDKLLAIFERSWSYQVQVRFPEAKFVIQRMIDEEYGDLGLRLIQV